ncbi:hypothetical protein [Streptomyces sp. NPDC023588]|uniref:hypothetical protein n=1 Tax=Streptomyces sp. NPDC023588 TaxID=3154907 RepID=UPI0033CB7736
MARHLGVGRSTLYRTLAADDEPPRPLPHLVSPTADTLVSSDTVGVVRRVDVSGMRRVMTGGTQSPCQ